VLTHGMMTVFTSDSNSRRTDSLVGIGTEGVGVATRMELFDTEGVGVLAISWIDCDFDQVCFVCRSYL
jgi:hypothetical protein